MLLPRAALDGIRDGTVTVAFRRWRRPTVRAGGSLLTPVGLLSIVAVTPIELANITRADARRAGYDSLDDLVSELQRRPNGTYYRIDLGSLRPDPRVALREKTDTDRDVITLAQRLQRLDDRALAGPWTRRTLDLIAAHPGVRAGDLARAAHLPKDVFKLNVRKLKAIGLTESLEVGYRLSARGQRFLKSWRAARL